MRKFSIAYGAFGLFYLGYTVGVMDEWQKLLMPAVHLLNAFVFFSIGKWSDPARTKR